MDGGLFHLDGLCVCVCADVGSRCGASREMGEVSLWLMRPGTQRSDEQCLGCLPRAVAVQQPPKTLVSQSGDLYDSLTKQGADSIAMSEEVAASFSLEVTTATTPHPIYTTR